MLDSDPKDVNEKRWGNGSQKKGAVAGVIILSVQIDTVAIRKAACSKALRFCFNRNSTYFRSSFIHKSFGSGTVSICRKGRSPQ